jgi:hypothetical protein
MVETGQNGVVSTFWPDFRLDLLDFWPKAINPPNSIIQGHLVMVLGLATGTVTVPS